MVLVDTTVWSASLRRARRSPGSSQEKCRAELIALIESNQAQLLGVVRQELLSGIKERTQYERLRQSLRAFHDISLMTEDYEEAGAMNNFCRSKGIAGNSVDFLICAVASRRKWPILTLDREFARYATFLSIEIY